MYLRTWKMPKNFPIKDYLKELTKISNEFINSACPNTKVLQSRNCSFSQTCFKSLVSAKLMVFIVLLLTLARHFSAWPGLPLRAVPPGSGSLKLWVVVTEVSRRVATFSQEFWSSYCSFFAELLWFLRVYLLKYLPRFRIEDKFSINSMTVRLLGDYSFYQYLSLVQVRSSVFYSTSWK